jgi:hypothetical protein
MKVIPLINFILQVLLVFYNYFLVKLISYQFYSLLFLLIAGIMMVHKIMNESAAIQHNIILQSNYFFSCQFIPYHYQFIFFMFCILWCWYGLLTIVATLLTNSRIKIIKKKNILDLFMYAKKSSTTKFRQIYNLSVSITKRQCIILRYLCQTYMIISMCSVLVLIMIYHSNNFFLDDIYSFIFIYNMIPLVVIITCLIDYACNKYITCVFLSQNLKFVIYCHLHSILGTILLSASIFFVLLMIKYISLFHILALIVYFVLLVTMQILIINIFLLLVSVTLIRINKSSKRCTEKTVGE